MDSSNWTVIETQFKPAELHHKETLFTIGNGYLGTRGTFEEGYTGANPATLIHGVYDDVEIMHTELVNCPDWLPLTIVIAGDRFHLDHGEILSYQHQLDLRWGILSRDIVWRSPNGHTVHLHFERLSSMADKHVLLLRCAITSVNFQGEIAVEASINPELDNQGVKHWECLEHNGQDSYIWLHTRCYHSKIELGMATELKCSEPEAEIQVTGSLEQPVLATSFHTNPGKTVTIEKTVTVFTSREVNQPLTAAQERLKSLPSHSTLLAAHGAIWDELWRESDVVVEGDAIAQLAVRYNLFQLLAAAPRHDERVSIPAKTLSGFAYRGHVFWDTEIFIVPFLTYTQPHIARNLLSYRYHTLDGARRKAQAAGYEGAMYAWESATTGDEVTPRWVFDPNGQPVRIWCGDIEYHITTDVAYAVWHYWQATGDDQWMRSRGAEIILATAVFWGSRAEWNSDRNYYEIRHVIGPDENHEQVDNNTFTNRMVQWHLETAISVLEWLRQYDSEWATEIERQLELTPQRLKRWSHIIRHMLVLHNSNTGLIEQFEGFFALEDWNYADYQWRNKSMQAILGIEETKQRQILKQPDVLMLLYLLRESALSSHLSPSHYQQILEANWNYYTPRTDHTYGSSLGPAIHAILACDLDKPTEAYEHFMRAALVDMQDVRGNAGEGIHAASTGGVWQAVIFGFAGVRLTEQGPIVTTPRLPVNWTRLQFKLRWRNQWYEFDLSDTEVKVMKTENQIAEPAMLSEDWTKLAELFTTQYFAPSIQGVIFDLDGVLTDTAEYHYQAWKQLADEIGIPFDHKANEKMRGLSRRDSLLQMLGERKVTEAEIQVMMARKNAYYEKLIQALTPVDLLPGALELLEDLQAAGIKVAVGSSSKNARLVTKLLGIANRLDAIADGYSVEQHKPAPDVFLHAAAQLGLNPDQCLVVEDATSGVLAAIAAGMQVVGLGPEERVGAADLVLNSLEGIRWAGLATAIQHKISLTCPVPVHSQAA